MKIPSMATPAIPWFRDLYEEILEYEGLSLYEHVLGPWIEKAQAAMVDMGRFKSNRPLDRNDEAALDAIWNLYALGRVNDLLLMSIQDNRENNSFPFLSLNEYEDFFSHLGFTIETSTRRFPPFIMRSCRFINLRRTTSPSEFSSTCGPAWYSARCSSPEQVSW